MASLFGAFWFPGPLAWMAGLVYIVYDSVLLIVVVSAARRELETPGQPPRLSWPERQTVAVLICARNERRVLPDCLRSVREQDDPPEEILVVDDGSTDDSLAWLKGEYAIAAFDGRTASAQWPALRVLGKEATGKAVSLNEGLVHLGADIVITLDADTVMEPGALRAIRRAFTADMSLAAAGGILTPRCDRSLMGRFLEFHQQFEYLRGFVGRLAWCHYGCLVLVSGAFAAYRREVLQSLGGFHPWSLVEDYDLIHRLYRVAARRGVSWKVKVLGDARAVTDAPSKIGVFLRQRRRWFAGFLETLFDNRNMVGRRDYGAVGRIMLPVKTMDTLQPVYGLAAFMLLGPLLIFKPEWRCTILAVLAAKVMFDLVFHRWALSIYLKWRGEPWSWRKWRVSLAATLLEPFAFQVLRHFGAVLGWIAFLLGGADWKR